MPTDRSRICILSFSTISRDGRILRQIEYAGREYDIDVIGYGEWTPPWPNVRFWEAKRGRLGMVERLLNAIFLVGGRILPDLWLRAYWVPLYRRNVLELLLRRKYGIIHANELSALPVAIAAAERTGARVLFDAHEYSPGQSKNLAGKRKFIMPEYTSYFLRSFGSQADAFVTVSGGIANLYQEVFGFNPEIVMNAPIRAEVNFRPVDPNRIRLIHHGGATRKRQLEKLIEMIGLLDVRYTLHFMLIGKKDGYIDELERLAKRIAPGRVFFKEPVIPAQIVSALSKFDIGVCLVPPWPINYKYALPNKFFDFVAAGLAVAIGPSPEMAHLVKKHDFGVIAQGFEARDLAAVINSLTTEHINEMKRNALGAAGSLNADVEMEKVMEIYRRLLTKDSKAVGISS